jgi:hypothetical protein
VKKGSSEALILSKRRRPPIAQLAEQLPFKEKVPGSIPGGRTTSRKTKQTKTGLFCFPIALRARIEPVPASQEMFYLIS